MKANVYSNIAELLSVIAAIVYYYNKTKDKVVLWILSYISFCAICTILFRKLFPNIPFVSPTLEYMSYLAIVGIPFLVIVVVIGVEIEKQRTKAPEEYNKNRAAIFTPTRNNIIFWTVFVLINLVAFILGGTR
jgi:uncharacterized membrane protein